MKPASQHNNEGALTINPGCSLLCASRSKKRVATYTLLPKDVQMGCVKSAAIISSPSHSSNTISCGGLVRAISFHTASSCGPTQQSSLWCARSLAIASSMFVFKRSEIAAEPCFLAARSTRDSSRSRFALCGGATAASKGSTERLRLRVAISVSEGEDTYAMPQSMRRVMMDADSARFVEEILWPSKLPSMATSPSKRSHITSTCCRSTGTFCKQRHQAEP